MPACAPTLNPVLLLLLLLDEEESLVAVSVTSVLAGLNDTELVVVVVLLVGELVGSLVVMLVVVDEMSAPSVTWLRWLNS